MTVQAMAASRRVRWGLCVIFFQVEGSLRHIRCAFCKTNKVSCDVIANSLDYSP